MCIPAVRRKPAPRPTGVARWVCDNPKELIDSGLPALLSITVQRKDGEFTGYYAVSAQEGGWLVSRQEGAGYAESYWLTRDCWSCNCPATKDRAGDCKHTLGVQAALKRVGLI